MFLINSALYLPLLRCKFYSIFLTNNPGKSQVADDDIKPLQVEYPQTLFSSFSRPYGTTVVFKNFEPALA
jgi:hypothetical protein